MKSLCGSISSSGDPDGTRKRPAHFYGLSTTAAAQQYQALGRQRSPERAAKARPVDKKTAKRGTAFVALLLSLSPILGGVA